MLSSISEVAIPHGGVLNLGPDKGFTLQLMRREEALPDDAALTFITQRGWKRTIRLLDLTHDRAKTYRGPAVMDEFFATVDAIPNAQVLDIGGRDRSGIDWQENFRQARVTVLDVLPGENVHIVGDAHALASLVPPESFDAVISIATFEHLQMPWAVVPQINRVLKPGGIALIASHQTMGLHDMPFDFWRFSDTAWDGLFNRHTGFEITERVMQVEQHVLPYLYRPILAFAERAAGYEVSTVVARKIGPCDLSWPVTSADLTRSAAYPPGTEDPFAPKG